MNDVIPAGRAALQQFKANGKIDFPADMSSNDFDVWASIFEADWNGWKLVRYEQMQRLVTESHARCETDNFCKPIVASSALLAVVSTRNYHPTELEGDDRPKAITLQKLFAEMYPVMENMWLSAFASEPLFTETFAQSKRIYGYS